MLHLCHFSLKDSPAKPSMCSFLFTGFRAKTRIYTFSLIFLYKGTSGFQNLHEPFLTYRKLISLFRFSQNCENVRYEVWQGHRRYIEQLSGSLHNEGL